jgi:ribosomal protein L11 methyltransferase
LAYKDEAAWLEVSVKVEGEVAEAVAEVLSRYAHRGVVIESGPGGWNAGPVVVVAYLPIDDQVWEKKRDIEEGIWHLGQIQPIAEPNFETIVESDWTELWKDQLEVLRVGERIVIQPSWRDYSPEPGDIVVELDPGMAFGTGLHPTTQLCLTALEGLVQPGFTVLDLGTGSGILAIAAAKLGAGEVWAVDNDPEAVRVARHNVSANGVAGKVHVIQGSLPEVTGCYDVVVVNILARVIEEMAGEGLVECVCPTGTLIASGIVEEQEADVGAALEQGGFTLLNRRQQGDWVNLQATRGYSSRR